MDKKTVASNGVNIAILRDDDLIITDAGSALDLMSTIQYYDKCERIAIYKECVNEEFFRLSSGLAGEIMQKFVNYSKKLAIIGDFSHYTSKPLHDFIYESNKGNDIFFVSNEEEAINKLSGAI